MDDLRRQIAEHSTDELIEILARRDEDEWRAEVFPLVRSILQERGVDVDALPAAAPAAPHEPDDEWVVVDAFLNPVDADVAQAALEAAGIPVQAVDEHLSSMHIGLGMAAGGVKLAVPGSQAVAAREILAAGASGESAGAVPLECPACGAGDVSSERVLDRLVSALAFLAGPGPVKTYSVRFTCRACGHAWQ